MTPWQGMICGQRSALRWLIKMAPPLVVAGSLSSSYSPSFWESKNILGSPEPGLGSPEGCKRVAGGRRDHRKGIPLILSTLKGCETLPSLIARAGTPSGCPQKNPVFRWSTTTGYYLAALQAALTSFPRPTEGCR